MPALIITTQVPVSVALTNGAGTAVAVYSDAAMSSSVSQPLTVSSSSTVYVAAGPVRVVASDGSSTALLDTVVAVPIAGSVTATVPAPSVPQLANLYSAQSVLAATADNSPAPVTLAEGTLLGRATGGNVAALTAAQAGLPTLENYRMRWSQPSSGLDTVPRDLVSTAIAPSASGFLTLSSFRVLGSVTFTQISMGTGATAAGATPSLCRFGVYSSGDDGSTWTLLCAVANDTTLFAAANTVYTRALDSGGGLPTSYTCVPGVLYALGVIVVSATTLPTLVGVPASSSAALMALPPPMSQHKAGLTDLSASLTGTSGTVRRYWGRLSS